MATPTDTTNTGLDLTDAGNTLLALATNIVAQHVNRGSEGATVAPTPPATAAPSVEPAAPWYKDKTTLTLGAVLGAVVLFLMLRK